MLLNAKKCLVIGKCDAEFTYSGVEGEYRLVQNSLAPFMWNKPGFPALPGGMGIIETFYNTFSKHNNVFSECNYFEQIPKNSCQQLHSIGCQGLGAAFSNPLLILNLALKVVSKCTSNVFS